MKVKIQKDHAMRVINTFRVLGREDAVSLSRDGVTVDADPRTMEIAFLQLNFLISPTGRVFWVRDSADPELARNPLLPRWVVVGEVLR